MTAPHLPNLSKAHDTSSLPGCPINPPAVLAPRSNELSGVAP